ncbi:MAG: hypothetical protein KDI69_02040 [Xanthomonadales bacterium]|nr:hypothetical protein [Xanthomonadales bacterium]
MNSVALPGFVACHVGAETSAMQASTQDAGDETAGRSNDATDQRIETESAPHETQDSPLSKLPTEDG